LHSSGWFTVAVVSTTTPTPDELVDAFILVTADQQRPIVTAYRYLSEGAPVVSAVLAAASGWTPATVDAQLRSSPGDLYVDGDGGRSACGAWPSGRSARRRRHRRSGTGWISCALDPLFIMLVFGTAEVPPRPSRLSGLRPCRRPQDKPSTRTGLAPWEPVMTDQPQVSLPPVAGDTSPSHVRQAGSCDRV
jgi:hypothetical protein